MPASPPFTTPFACGLHTVSLPAATNNAHVAIIAKNAFKRNFSQLHGCFKTQVGNIGRGESKKWDGSGMNNLTSCAYHPLRPSRAGAPNARFSFTFNALSILIRRKVVCVIFGLFLSGK
jgi:hypothetical protein